jgi:hypothetical protein
VLAVKGQSSFLLTRAGVAQDRIQLSLRQKDANQATLPTSEPSARLLLSARAVQTVSNPSPVIPAGVLPELDRAVAIVGLFETGTTDCGRHVYFLPGASSGTRVPAVGCLTVSIPGWLGEIITSLDGGDQHRLDVLLGDDAAAIRGLVPDHGAVLPEPVLREAMQRLTAAPEFWIAYQARVLAGYAQATDLARQFGLVSERGTLLVFDRLVASGSPAVAHALRSYQERYPHRPDTEAARIQALGEILAAQARTPFDKRRIDAIVTGHGSVNGISFDLEQLGIPAA